MKFSCPGTSSSSAHMVKVLTCLVILIYCCLPSVQATVIVFTVFDVFAELESWGRLTLGRFNASGAATSGWPVPDFGHSNSQTIELTEIRLLDQNKEWVKSHRFDSNLRNFAVSDWHEENYHGLRAHARKIETIRLGEVNGKISMLTYIITEDGGLNTSASGLSSDVTRGDVIIKLEFENVTEGCVECASLEVELSFWGHCACQEGSTSGVTEMSMTPGDAHVWLPNTVLLDGNLTNLNEGSPTHHQLDTSVLVTLSMPLPVTSAAYSALLRLGGDSTAHLIKERLVHKTYGEESHQMTTEIPGPDVTSQTTPGGQKGVDNKSQNAKGKDSNGVKVANPEYRHVKDNTASSAEPCSSSKLPLLSVLIALGLVSQEVFRELFLPAGMNI